METLFSAQLCCESNTTLKYKIYYFLNKEERWAQVFASVQSFFIINIIVVPPLLLSFSLSAPTIHNSRF